ncbi:MAG TPA: alpha-glucuronidase family glycosyl hydrolase, partial [Sedimentisphaerales bacterium]|nr:alpha-glucuronidase family glycosyl hydrolase [Sedimentisphaerales bacterium]
MMRSLIILVLLSLPLAAHAEDGSRLWLRYEPLPAAQASLVNQSLQGVHADLSLPSLSAAIEELQRAVKGFTGRDLPIIPRLRNQSVVLVVGGSQLAKTFGLNEELAAMHRDGYIIRPMSENRQSYIVVASPAQVGVLYGVFHLIRSIQTAEFTPQLTVKSEPRFDVRILNHWDNLNGTVERGYAGRSLWLWNELPNTLSPRYRDYARVN